ncbi:MAG TPA: hypothetical protein PKC13_25770, partial [Blastocatellia bacterium]|nr:hypothetical protein [Blastocatellia bacterium]
MYLTIVDTTQIQAYVFASNRLRENIGASHLVAQATGEWAREAVNQSAISHNIADIGKGKLNQQRMVVADSSLGAEAVDAEVMYTGGGNAVVLFQTFGQVSMFKRKLSRRVLKEAPGLQLVIAEQEFDWAKESLVKVVNDVFGKLNEAKRVRSHSVPLLGLGVTVECQSTALPAVEYAKIVEGEDRRPVSAETAAKLQANKTAKDRLEEICGSLTERGYDYPDELDHLGRESGEQSYIAVVHADGDGMGQKIKEIGDKDEHCITDENGSYATANRCYISALRVFSQSVEVAAQAALKTTLSGLLNAIDVNDLSISHNGGADWIAPIKLTEKKSENGYYVPFRPIVFGGDDVTFVCDGRLGLALAKVYAEEFAKETSNRACGKLTACLGVVLVKAHYPFARAYQMAEQLLKSAKTYRRKIKDDYSEWSNACVDWHFALTGLFGSLGDIREREYQVKDGSLLLRPLTLNNNPKDKHRSWLVLGNILKQYQKDWGERRNKMKALRESLRSGPDAVKEFMALYDLKKLPESGLNKDEAARETGWIDDRRCRDFDAIEMTDWYIPI